MAGSNEELKIDDLWGNRVRHIVHLVKARSLKTAHDTKISHVYTFG